MDALPAFVCYLCDRETPCPTAMSGRVGTGLRHAQPPLQLTEQLKARGIHPQAKHRKDQLVQMLMKHIAAKAERPAVLPSLPADFDDGAVAATLAEPDWSRAGRPSKYGKTPLPQSARPSSDPLPTLQQLSQWTLAKLKEVRMPDQCLRRALHRVQLLTTTRPCLRSVTPQFSVHCNNATCYVILGHVVFHLHSQNLHPSRPPAPYSTAAVQMSVRIMQELRKRKLIVSGKKQDLAERLLESMQKSAAAGVDGPVRDPIYDDDGQEVELTDDLKPEDVDHLTVRLGQSGSKLCVAE